MGLTNKCTFHLANVLWLPEENSQTAVFVPVQAVASSNRTAGRSVAAAGLADLRTCTEAYRNVFTRYASSSILNTTQNIFSCISKCILKNNVT